MPQKKTFKGQIIQVQLEMAYQLLLFAKFIKVTETSLFTIVQEIYVFNRNVIFRLIFLMWSLSNNPRLRKRSRDTLRAP